MDFNFVPGGGGRRGKPRQSRIYNWEWTVTRKFPGETEVNGKGRVSNPFGEDCVEIRLKKLDLS